MAVGRRHEPRRHNLGCVNRGAALFTPPCGELYPQTGAATREPCNTGWTDDTAQAENRLQEKPYRAGNRRRRAVAQQQQGAVLPTPGRRGGERRRDHRSADLVTAIRRAAWWPCHKRATVPPPAPPSPLAGSAEQVAGAGEAVRRLAQENWKQMEAQVRPGTAWSVSQNRTHQNIGTQGKQERAEESVQKVHKTMNENREAGTAVPG